MKKGAKVIGMERRRFSGVGNYCLHQISLLLLDIHSSRDKTCIHPHSVSEKKSINYFVQVFAVKSEKCEYIYLLRFLQAYSILFEISDHFECHPNTIGHFPSTIENSNSVIFDIILSGRIFLQKITTSFYEENKKFVILT